MLRILVTNDDGIKALGIRLLVEALLPLEDVEIFVSAPREEKSGVGHGVTYREALAPQEDDFYGLPVKAWSVNGNPADCVKAAYHLLFDQQKKPDVVFSGINVGNNLGKDVYYSGTCSAAREGVILGMPAVALSYDNYFHPDNFGQAKEMLQPLLSDFSAKARSGELAKEVFWNVNIPHVSTTELKGVTPASLSMYHYEDKYHLEAEGYWLRREYFEEANHLEDEDYPLLKAGYITITPIHIDSTDRKLLADMAAWPLMSRRDSEGG